MLEEPLNEEVGKRGLADTIVACLFPEQNLVGKGRRMGCRNIILEVQAGHVGSHGAQKY